MILVAGGTGRLGRQVVELLQEHGLEVRVLTRDRDRARSVLRPDVQIVDGDVRDPDAVRRAVAGANTVVSAIQGLVGGKGITPETVDRDGNRNLIHAAVEAGVAQFVLVSVKDAGPAHPVDLMRMKYAAEQALRATAMSWTILRPAPYMETWCEVLGRPLLARGKTKVFGRGRNPINWVAASDVARFIERAIVERDMENEVIDVGGPENLSQTAFVDVFQREVGVVGKVGHIPPLVMRLTAVAMGPLKPSLAGQIRAGIAMDTVNMAFDASAVRRRYASIPSTPLADVVRRDFVSVGSREGAQRPATIG